MQLSVLGINHHSAPVDVREQVAFAPETMVDALNDAREALGIDELVILSTCNRTEIYAATESGDGNLLRWLSDYKRAPMEALARCAYDSEGDEAIAHMIRVASGLDSLVLGEPQILGQVKSAFTVAREAGAVGSVLNSAFQHIFAVAKRVRTETAIGQNPVSVAYAAVSLAQRIFSDLAEVNALLIGAGETIELVAQHLRQKNVGSITVANRTLSRAADLARAHGAQAILLSDIHDHLPKADMVISSTASQLPILGKGAVESALKQRRHKPMFMVDIAVPRDIEPEVAKLNDVYLYTVDDLKDVIEENLRHREQAASHAETIIREGVESWRKQLRAQNAVGTIRAFRQSVEQLRDAELDKALAALQRGQPAEEVLTALARSLTNKLLHTPTLRLKKAGEEGRDDHIRLAHELFDIQSGCQDKT
ncbi:MAG: glutamyl-tRNA reductase [Porticoccaceae bacterium]|jgi:glutamyl-tRNA reductase|nr:glutamyl-tRNA reductase [Porticoccaceae bacterium]MEA3298819.1 glutamyl-tRNA reductase [Pseudomonadota bacterium]HLS97249.1 glutamyl-tRNA reductase [Porticoccaceae bacterium]